MQNPDLKNLIDGLNQLTVCSNRLCGYRGHPGEMEAIRSELHLKALPAYQQFQEAVQHLAIKFFPEMQPRQ